MRYSNARAAAWRSKIPGRLRSRLVLILLVAACGPWVRAQTMAPGAQRIMHDSWTFKEGAPESVENLAQTADGYLWLGSSTGLFRFDGLRFERFHSPFGNQLSSTGVTALLGPDTGGLWVGYRLGGFSFIKNGEIENFIEDTSSTGTVYSFAQGRDGTVWAATTNGAWRFNGSSWQHIQAEWNAPVESVCQVGFDREGILWALTDSRGAGKKLFYLQSGSRQFQKAGDNLLIEGFTWDADHTVLTTHEGRRPALGPGIELQDSLPAYPVLRKDSAQILDRANGIWLLPKDPFVMRHAAAEPLGEVLGQISPRNSQVYEINPYRFSFLVDREGSIWIGDTKGVHRFSYSPLIQQEFPKTEPGNPIFALAPDEGGVVWVSAGNQNGSSNLYRVAGGKAEFQKSLGGAANFAYRAQDKTFWFGGEGGLWHLVNGAVAKVALPPGWAEKAQYLQTITQDRLGGMWISFGRRGLYRLADGVWTSNGGHSDIATAGVYIAFTDHLGRTWFGGRNNTLALLDGDRVQVFGPADGLQLGNITAIYGRGAEIWIGGELGLQQFDGGRFHSIAPLDKEAVRGITGIVEKANGDLWLNGLGGIVHIRHAELQEALKNPAHQVSGEHFGRREGLPGLPSQLRPLFSAIEGTDGRLWFPVANGVVWLDPAQSSNQAPPPPVTIQSISADDRSYRFELPLKFPAHTANVLITYAAVSLADPEAVHFRYKMKETDKEWHEAGTNTSVSYRNLSPGSYHFLVAASDSNGTWPEHTAITEFTILPAYYQTNWFRAVCVIAFLLVLWMAYHLRVRQVERQFARSLEARVAERTRIARDLHDTLLQSFQGLLLRFQTVLHLLPEGAAVEARKELESVIDQATAAITEGRDAVQGLRASALDTGDLASAISSLGQEIAAADGGHEAAALRVTVEGAARKLHALVRDEICAIATEALRNAFRHAQAKQIEVEIRYDPQQFRLRVRDNGKGIDPAVLAGQERAGHFGLRGMRERARVTGGTLAVWSEVDGGTELELRIPAGAAYIKDAGRSWLARTFARKAGV